jgi:hypothetical protein
MDRGLFRYVARAREAATGAAIVAILLLSASIANADVSVTTKFTRGPSGGTSLRVVITNTGNEDISELYFSLDQSGFTISGVSDDKGLGCKVFASNEIYCGLPLHAGDTVTIDLTTDELYPVDGDGVLTIYDSADDQQPPITVTGPSGTTGCQVDVALKITSHRPDTDDDPRSSGDAQAIFTGYGRVIFGSIAGRFSVTNNKCRAVTERVSGVLAQGGRTVSSLNFDLRGGDCDAGQRAWDCKLGPGETATAPFEFSSLDRLAGSPITLTLTATPPDATPKDNKASAPITVIPGPRSSIGHLPASEPRSQLTNINGSGGTNANADVTTASENPTPVAEVQVAIVRTTSGCQWLKSVNGGFKKEPSTNGACLTGPVWLRAQGTYKWRLRLASQLPKGKYTFFSRATDAGGFTEGLWGSSQGNTAQIKLT